MTDVVLQADAVIVGGGPSGLAEAARAGSQVLRFLDVSVGPWNCSSAT